MKKKTSVKATTTEQIAVGTNVMPHVLICADNVDLLPNNLQISQNAKHITMYAANPATVSFNIFTIS